MDKHLKPCPKCGSNNLDEDYGNVIEGSYDMQYGGIECLGCGITLFIETDGKSITTDNISNTLIDSWNERKGEVAGLEDQLEQYKNLVYFLDKYLLQIKEVIRKWENKDG